MGHADRDSLELSVAGAIAAQRKRFGLEVDDAESPLLRRFLRAIIEIGDEKFKQISLDDTFDRAELTPSDRQDIGLQSGLTDSVDETRARNLAERLRELAEKERTQAKLEQAVGDGNHDRARDILHESRKTNTPKPRRLRQWKGFPLEVLPLTLRDFVTEHARVMGVDPSMIATPLLVACAGFIGNTVAVRVRGGWIEPCSLWWGLVARSGSKKSPAMNAAMQPFRTVQARHAKTAKDANVGKQLDEHVKAKRRFIDDATPEAILNVLADNPRGLLSHRDELAELFAGFGRYKTGKSAGVGEASQACRLFDASPLDIDRKSSGHRHVPKPLLSIYGAIPTKTLRRLTDDTFKENGLFARFLFLQPPTKPAKFTNEDADWRVDAGFTELAERLDALTLDVDDVTDVPKPCLLTLDDRASNFFRREHDRLQKFAHELGEGLAASKASKTAGLVARFACVLHVVETLTDSTFGDCSPSEAVQARSTISVDTMRRAIVLTCWAFDETLRVFAQLETDAETVELEELAASIDWAKYPKGITSRELWKNRKTRFDDAEAAETTLRKCASLGLLEERFGVRGDEDLGGKRTLIFTPLAARESETPSNADEVEGNGVSSDDEETEGNDGEE